MKKEEITIRVATVIAWSMILTFVLTMLACFIPIAVHLIRVIAEFWNLS